MPGYAAGRPKRARRHAAAPTVSRNASAERQPGGSFGGITQGVIKAAARGSGQNAPVYRLEELHRARLESLAEIC